MHSSTVEHLMAFTVSGRLGNGTIEREQSQMDLLVSYWCEHGQVIFGTGFYCAKVLGRNLIRQNQNLSRLAAR